MPQNLSMTQSGKIEVEEDVIRTYVSVYLIYGKKRSIASFQNIVSETALTGYATEFTIIDYQT